MTQHITLKRLILGIVFLGFALFAPGVFAEEDTSTSSQAEQRQEQRDEMQAERLEHRQEALKERKAALTDRTQDRITNLANNMKRRMGAAVDRLSNIADRMETRIEKLGERGVETGEAFGHVEDARDSLEAAQAILDDIDVLVENAVTSDNPREAFGAVHEQFEIVRDLIKEAHEHLRLALATLKDAVVDAGLGRGVSDATTDTERDEKATSTDSE